MSELRLRQRTLKAAAARVGRARGPRHQPAHGLHRQARAAKAVFVRQRMPALAADKAGISPDTWPYFVMTTPPFTLARPAPPRRSWPSARPPCRGGYQQQPAPAEVPASRARLTDTRPAGLAAMERSLYTAPLHKASYICQFSKRGRNEFPAPFFTSRPPGRGSLYVELSPQRTSFLSSRTWEQRPCSQRCCRPDRSRGRYRCPAPGLYGAWSLPA